VGTAVCYSHFHADHVKCDFDFYVRYLDEVAALVREECPRPDVTPDLSQTDYLRPGWR